MTGPDALLNIQVCSEAKAHRQDPIMAADVHPNGDGAESIAIREHMKGLQGVRSNHRHQTRALIDSMMLAPLFLHILSVLP